MATKEKELIDKWKQGGDDGDGDYEDDEWSCTDSEDHSCSQVDSDDDPSYEPSEDTVAGLSALSIGNASTIGRGNKPVVIGSKQHVADVTEEGHGAGERDIVDAVRALVNVGQLEKLKVDECKHYLRKNGLRLTGNKETLIQRIREHYEMMAGEGERKYPVHSFVINCKGDACIGDVVMFEQNVYEQYSIASRSATAPPCGKRIVAGRIVKESYGAQKQQHTFTIEVLWSKGEKSFPPLHPFLIKGRNLYRVRTLRQRWEDEDQRQRILMEKHSRGDVARSDREARIKEKETRNMMRANRMPKTSQAKVCSAGAGKPGNKDSHLVVSGSKFREASGSNLQDCIDKIGIRHHPFQDNDRGRPYQPGFWGPAPNPRHSSTAASSHCFPDGRPLANMNGLPRGKHQVCRYFEQGRCHFGDNCKFLHQYKERAREAPRGLF